MLFTISYNPTFRTIPKIRTNQRCWTLPNNAIAEPRMLSSLNLWGLLPEELGSIVSSIRSQPSAGPAAWGALSISIWMLYAFVRSWAMMGRWDRQQFFWGVTSAIAFLNFLHLDPEFEGWGDVYFFCGRRLQYCSCNFRWNAYGWAKATVLWNFVLTAALGAQRLATQVGLNGLLPGESGG